MSRLVRTAVWVVPPLFCLWLYRWGLQSWFQQDDFAWLGLPLHFTDTGELWDLLFAPRAQGTIRPLSERLFFLVFASASWMDPRPFHVWVFITAVCVLLMLSWLALRLTGSRWAALAAPLLWLCGIGPANPMSWISSYNQVLESFFLLGGICALDRAAETNDRRWWIAQWAAFLLGFGALEIHVVYPFLALAYAWLFARHVLRKVAWMIPVSVAYAAYHFLVVPKPEGGPYARYWDMSLFSTLFKYAGLAFGGGQVLPGSPLPAQAWLWGAWVVGLVVCAASVWQAIGRKNYAPAFGILWFLGVLAPIVPLRDHVMEYYLTAPGIGLSLAAGALLAAALQAGWAWRGIAVLLVAVHLILVLPLNRTITTWRYQRGERIRALVEGLERAAFLHKNKIILLTGINSELFWSCLLDSPGRLFGAQEVFLAPGAEQKLDNHADLGNLAAYVADPGMTARTLAQRSAVVYEFDGTRLRNITKVYRRSIPKSWLFERPRQIDAAHPAFSTELGEGWNPPDGSFRWMTQKGTVFLAPARDGDHLFLSAYLPLGLKGRPQRIQVSLNGRALGAFDLPAQEEWIELNINIPSDLTGTPAKVGLQLDRSVRLPGDPTDYGLAFGKIGFR